MARVARVKRVPDARTYTPEQWLKYGTNPEPTTREKMVLLAIEEIIIAGPGDFNAAVVCDRLGIAYPMINHNFGDRDGLIAEAIMAAHDSWSRGVERSFKDGPTDPRKRLRRFVEHEILWGRKMRGMGVLMHYPTVSTRVSRAVRGQFGERMQRNFEFHLALITVTVADITAKRVSSLDFGRDDFPRTTLALAHPHAFAAATSISWATHGLALWSGGDHVATSDLALATLEKLSREVVVKNHVTNIIAIAENAAK